MKIAGIRELLLAAGVEYEAGLGKGALIELMQLYRVPRPVVAAVGEGKEMEVKDDCDRRPIGELLTCLRGPRCPPDLPAGARYCTDCGLLRPAFPLCGFCRAPQPSPSAFCSQCGHSNGPPPCLGCGAALLASARFCPACGVQAYGAVVSGHPHPTARASLEVGGMHGLGRSSGGDSVGRVHLGEDLLAGLTGPMAAAARFLGPKTIAALGSNDVKDCELRRFLPLDAQGRVAAFTASRAEPVLTLNSDKHISWMVPTAKARELESELELSSAFRAFLGLRSMVAPSTAADNALVESIWSGWLRDHPRGWRAVYQAIEAKRLWCALEGVTELSTPNADAERPLMLETIRAMSAGSARPRAVDGADSVFHRMLVRCRPGRLCARWQLGTCSESSGHNGFEHTCIECGARGHGSSACSASPAPRMQHAGGELRGDTGARWPARGRGGGGSGRGRGGGRARGGRGGHLPVPLHRPG